MPASQSGSVPSGSARKLRIAVQRPRAPLVEVHEGSRSRRCAGRDRGSRPASCRGQALRGAGRGLQASSRIEYIGRLSGAKSGGPAMVRACAMCTIAVHRQLCRHDKVASVVDQPPAIARPDARAVIAVHRRGPFWRIAGAEIVARPRGVGTQDAVLLAGHLVDAPVFRDRRAEGAGRQRRGRCPGGFGWAIGVPLARGQSEGGLGPAGSCNWGRPGSPYRIRTLPSGSGASSRTRGTWPFGMRADRVEVVRLVAVGGKHDARDGGAGGEFCAGLGLAVGRFHCESAGAST